MHQVTLATPDGTLAQRIAITAGQKTILTALGVAEPPRILDITTSAG